MRPPAIPPAIPPIAPGDKPDFTAIGLEAIVAFVVDFGRDAVAMGDEFDVAVVGPLAVVVAAF